MRLKRLALTLLLSAFALIQGFPLLWTLLFSLKTNSEIMLRGAVALPQTPVWDNYRNAWETAKVGQYFLNSLLVSSCTLAATLLFSGTIAYAISRMKWKLSGPTLYLFMAGLMVPIHVTLIPLFIILNRLGILTSYLGIILPYIAVGLPLGVFVTANFLRSMPRELEEAAVIDGCGIPRLYFGVVVPILTPALSSVGIFTFLNSWNEFIMAATYIQNPAMRTLPVGIRAFVGTYSIDWGPMGAAVIISTIPLFIMYVLFSERVERSMIAGAVLK